LIGALIFSSTAHATPTFVSNASEVDDSEVEDSWGEEKSAAVALALSIGVTVGALALAFSLDSDPGMEGVGPAFSMVGLLIGPSVGQMYAGEHGKAWAHVGIRAGIAVATAGLLIVVLVSDFSLPSLLLAGGGAIAFTGFAIWDIMDGAQLCNDYNEGLVMSHRWSVQPTVLGAVNKKQENRFLPGLAFNLSF